MLEAGTGPLALCLHGFPDSAHTWRHLLPALAGAGFHAVAPFMRGYGPAVQAAGTADRYAAEQQASGRQAPQPTLYLHGARDGCIGADLARGSERFLAPSSRMIVIGDAGHFLHRENPGQVNDHILSWVS